MDNDAMYAAGAQRLFNAVMMQAFDDYRHAVFYGNKAEEDDLLRFFEDIRFNEAHVERLKKGVDLFKQALLKYRYISGRKRSKQVFTCPICGGNAAFSYTRNRLRHAKCDGCGMSGTIADAAMIS